MKNIDTVLAEKEIKLKNLYERIEELENNIAISNKKVEMLESALLRNINPEDVNAAVSV